jgi:hypothetical protein
MPRGGTRRMGGGGTGTGDIPHEFSAGECKFGMRYHWENVKDPMRFVRVAAPSRIISAIVPRARGEGICDPEGGIVKAGALRRNRQSRLASAKIIHRST